MYGKIQLFDYDFSFYCSYRSIDLAQAFVIVCAIVCSIKKIKKFKMISYRELSFLCYKNRYRLCNDFHFLLKFLGEKNYQMHYLFYSIKPEQVIYSRIEFPSPLDFWSIFFPTRYDWAKRKQSNVYIGKHVSK